MKNELLVGIHDFLAQVEMFRQAEQMSDHQLLQKIPHLLIGSARTWYTLNRYRILTWNDFVTQIKQRFLSTDYNFLLYSEVQNRKQGKNEPIGNYVADMQSKFRAMSNPPDMQHRLYMVRNNMLYEHAMALATQNVQSVEHLEMLVKQRESARASQMTYRRQMNALKPLVNEVEVEEQLGAENDSEGERMSERINEEVNAVESNERRRFNPRNQEKKQSGAIKTKKSAAICFNCKKSGHVFMDCPEKITRIFCFRCGKDGNMAPKCTNCLASKNGQALLLEIEQSGSEAEESI